MSEVIESKENIRWNPIKYKQTEQIRISVCEELFDWAKLKTLDHKKILDLGCGNGSIDHYLVNKYQNLSITALDNNKEMIEFSKNTYHHPNLYFTESDAQNFHFDMKFDYVISLAALHWVENQQQVLQCIYEHLNEGGKALLLLYPEQPYLWKAVNHVITYDKWKIYFNHFKHGYYFYTEETYRKLTVKIGFKINQIETVKENYHYNTQEQFEKLVSSWLPHLSQIPNHKHHEFLKDIGDLSLCLMKKKGIDNFADYRGLSLRVFLEKY